MLGEGLVDAAAVLGEGLVDAAAVLGEGLVDAAAVAATLLPRFALAGVT